MAEQVVVGIDVSKAKLDVAILPDGEQFTVSNDRAGVARLVARLRSLAPSRVVVEATGKLERLRPVNWWRQGCRWPWLIRAG